jgi:hypothetical protein
MGLASLAEHSWHASPQDLGQTWCDDRSVAVQSASELQMSIPFLKDGEQGAAAAGPNQHLHGCPWWIGSAVLRSRESP